MKARPDPVFQHARNMKVGGSITFDPSVEGTGERASGVIKEISRSFLSLTLKDGLSIGVTRVYSYNPPVETNHAFLPEVPRRAQEKPKEKPWFIRADPDDEGEEPPAGHISHPF